MPGRPNDGVSLWGRWECGFELSGADPAATELRVDLTSPSGRRRVVAGFWDGGTTWRVRVMPSEEGEWSFRAQATPGGVVVNEPEGAFVCAAADGGLGSFFQHGAVRVADNGTHFEHADGTPFFWLADTAWNGALLSTATDWQTYLRDRSDKAFRAIQFVTTHWRAARASADGLTAYAGRERISINPDFFRRIDARMDAVNAAGLLAAPVLLWALGGRDVSPGQLPEDQAVRLARYVVARYQAHHVVWFLGGDGDYAGEHARRWRRIGRRVFADPPHAPVAMHPRGLDWPYADFAGEPWLGVYGYQSGHGDDDAALRWIHSGPPSQAWPTLPPRPVINLEPPYEEHLAYQSKRPHTASSVRQASYWSLLCAPTAGVSYGTLGVWPWSTAHQVPTDHPGAGVARPWHEAITTPGAAHMGHLVELFTSLPWWTLRPDQGLLVRQPGGDDPALHVAVARGAGDDVVVCYLPAGGEAPLDPDRIAPGRGRWFDPRSGTRRTAEPSAPGLYVAPDAEDWVLVLAKET